MKLLQKYKYAAISLISSASLLPSKVFADGLTYDDFYSAVSSGSGAEVLMSDEGRFYESGLNNLFSWGMQLLQFVYVITFAVTFVALVINIIRLIISGDNSKKVEAARHDIMINMLGIALCGSIGAIYVFVLTLINMF